MNVKELIEKLEKIEDKTLDVRAEIPDISENMWITDIEISNVGDPGYGIFGEVRLICME